MARKTTARKSATKKSATKKSATKKSATKKSATKKSAREEAAAPAVEAENSEEREFEKSAEMEETRARDDKLRPDPEDEGPEFFEATEKDWSDKSPKFRLAYLNQISAKYKALNKEHYNLSNRNALSYRKLSRSHKKWRLSLIVATGVLAVVNVTAAIKFPLFPIDTTWLSIGAAIYAAVLAVGATIEGFLNYLERAFGFRDARETFLDLSRDYQRKWHVRVDSFGIGAKACVNANLLYAELVADDKRARAHIREITTDGRRD